MLSAVQLAEGVRFAALSDDRFKTDRLTVALSLPLEKDKISARSLLPFLLTRCCAAYPTVTAMRQRLNMLYGASVSAEVLKVGENQVLLISAVSLADRYALKGECVSGECTRLLLMQLFDPALENGLFREEDVEQEKRCLIEFIEAEFNSKRAYARRRCEELLCENEVCALSEYGTAEDAERVTPADVTAAWREALESAQMLWIYQGSGDGQVCADAVRDAFASGGRRNPLPVRCMQTPPVADGIRRKTEYTAVNQAKLFIGLRTACVGHSEQARITRLAVSLLGGTSQSLLFKNVREKMSLCYYCSATYDSHMGAVLIDSGVAEDAIEKAEEEILHQLSLLAAGEFTEEDWQNTRMQYISRLRGYRDSQSSMANWCIGRLLFGHGETPEEAIEQISAVTREQVCAAAALIRPQCVYVLRAEKGEE